MFMFNVWYILPQSFVFAQYSARQQLENKRGRITQIVLTVNIVSETNKHIQFCATCMGSDIYHLICIQV